MVGLLVSLNRKMAVVAAFLVIVPGLFFSVWLSSVMREPTVVIAGTTTANTVKWGIERPGGSVDLSEEAVNTFSNDEISSVFNLSIFDYDESYGGMGSQDTFCMNVTASSQASSGFIKNAYMVFEEDYGPSIFDWSESNVNWAELQNLYMKEYADFGELDSAGSEKAFARMEAVDNPQSTSFHAVAHWALYSPKNYTHLMNATLELVYFNGTVYKKLVQLIELGTHPDSNNTPETAEKIQNGTYAGNCVGGYDHHDYYSIYLTSNQKINVSVKNMFGSTWYNLYVYDPSLNQKAFDETNNYDKTIDMTADSSGYWLIEIRSLYESSSCMFYALEVYS